MNSIAKLRIQHPKLEGETESCLVSEQLQAGKHVSYHEVCYAHLSALAFQVCLGQLACP